jgi:Zn ribbon nucleic-acid-binding protein
MRGVIELLEGLRCAACGALDVLWLDATRGLVECRACGQGAYLTGETEEAI